MRVASVQHQPCPDIPFSPCRLSLYYTHLPASYQLQLLFPCVAYLDRSSASASLSNTCHSHQQRWYGYCEPHASLFLGRCRTLSERRHSPSSNAHGKHRICRICICACTRMRSTSSSWRSCTSRLSVSLRATIIVFLLLPVVVHCYFCLFVLSFVVTVTITSLLPICLSLPLLCSGVPYQKQHAHLNGLLSFFAQLART